MGVCVSQMATEREGELDGVMEGAVCISGSSSGSQGKAVCLRASALATPWPQQPTLLSWLWSPWPPQHPARGLATTLQHACAPRRWFPFTSELWPAPMGKHFEKPLITQSFPRRLSIFARASITAWTAPHAMYVHVCCVAPVCCRSRELAFDSEGWCWASELWRWWDELCVVVKLLCAVVSSFPLLPGWSQHCSAYLMTRLLAIGR